MKKYILTYATVYFLIICLITSSAISVEQKGKNCLDCHPKLFKKLSGEINHKPFAEKKCMSCHKLHGFENKLKLNAPIIEICTECHRIIDFLEEDEIHYPVIDDESCITCHLPHSADNKKLLVDSTIGTICIECHDGPTEDAQSVHAPFEQQNCVQCHDPHGSSFGSFFHLPVGYMCLECHSDVITDFAPEAMHSAKDGKSCEQCHSGHESEHTSLLKLEPTKLCLSCHSEIKKLVDNNEIHSVLEDESCVVCHTPHHQKSNQYLTETTPELCFTCHSDIEEKSEVKFPHAALDNGCMVCHNPHAGVLNDTEVNICLQCHDIDDDFKSLHPLKFEYKSCVSCHDPHGSNQKNMLKANFHPPYEENNCSSCHEDAKTRKELKSKDVCMICHDIDNSGAHKLNNTADKVCVDCHSPHTSNRNFLLKRL